MAEKYIKERKITKMEDWLTRALDNATEKGMEKGIEQACGILNSTVDEYEDAKKLLAEVPAGVFC
ncbi:MAG: hypothetical protein LUF30_11345 [Lachnospiraceae bacterium]|nr:hypothetical protein [Lachnospiraceae bacterium]